MAEGQSDDVTLKDIIVYASRRGLSLEEVSDAVFVYSSQDWSFVEGHDLSDFCFSLPSLSVSPGGEMGGSESISLQGSSPRQVKIMIEGIPLNSSASGQVNLNRFPVMGLKQVEVLTAGPSVLWGSGLGGVVNIVYEMPKEDLGDQVFFWWAENQSYGVCLQMAYDSEAMRGISWLDIGTALGSRKKGENSWKKGLVKLRLAKNQELLLGWSEGEVHSGLLPDGTWYHQPYRTTYGKLEFSPQIEDWTCTTRMTFLYQGLVSKMFLSEDSDIPFSRTDTKDQQITVSIVGQRFFSDDSLWVIGTDCAFVDLSSSYLSDSKQTSWLGLFSSWEHWWNEMSLSVGMRIDFTEDYGNAVAADVGLKLPVVVAGKSGMLRFNVSRAYSFPTLLWRYYDKSLTGISPNPDIQPEKAWVGSVGISLAEFPFSMQLDAYLSHITDAIALDLDAAGNYIMRNYKEFLREGVYGVIRYSPVESFVLRGGFQMGRVENCKSKVEQYGVLKLGMFLGMRWYLLEDWELDLVSYYQDWYQYPLAQARDHKWIWNLEIKRTWRRGELYLKVLNLGDSEFWDDYYYPSQRRYWECGIKLSW